MSVSAYVVVFFVAAYFGWLFESTYSILHSGKWERRGFLYGPYCPIYGVGVVVWLLLFNRPEVASGEFPAWMVFFVSMCSSAVLEYSVSVILERQFGAVWWDYSDFPLNVNGRICLPASLLFGAGGLFVTYIVAPVVNGLYPLFPSSVLELLALINVALMAADTTATVVSLSDLMDKIEQLDRSANEHAEEKVQQISDAVQQRTQGVRQGVGKAVTHQQIMVNGIANRITAHQALLLGRIRRFRTDDLRDRANALRLLLSERPENRHPGGDRNAS